ncbi:isochorismatase family cysteine hydrolase [Actinoplanes sp. NPDC026619]|uniref:cysteine hydrolase family protein n=1 Tax=Actinoplanes sp. NPDC026619 TaxID=3155798 RepID=UPI0033ED2E73
MSRSALLVLDIQNMVLAGYPDPEYLPRLGAAIGAARAAGHPVIYAVVGFRPDYAEVSTRNKMFGRLALAKPQAPPEAAAIPAEVAPQHGDIVVTKRRVSAFAGSDLDLVLRAGEIDHLVLTGVATSGVVLSTLREAADRDFRLSVLADGCLDNDPEVHRVLTEKVFPAQAEVTTIARWIAEPST